MQFILKIMFIGIYGLPLPVNVPTLNPDLLRLIHSNLSPFVEMPVHTDVVLAAATAAEMW